MARLKTLKLPKGVEIDEVSNDNFFTHPSATSVPTTLAVKDYLRDEINKHDQAFWPDGLHRNAIINGNFDIWQRGTSFTALSTNSYLADRWKHTFHSGDANHNMARSTDVPNSNSKYSLYITSTVEEESSVSTYDRISQYVEPFHLMGQKKWILSFYAKADEGLNYNNINVYPNVDGSYLGAAYSGPVATTWTRYEFPIDLTAYSPATSFHIMMGFYRGTISGYTNPVGKGYKIAQVQLNIGDKPLPFAPRPYAEELALCQRYYRRYNFKTGHRIGIGEAATRNSVHVPQFIDPPMRSTPTGTYSSATHFDMSGHDTGLSVFAVNGLSPSLVSLQPQIGDYYTVGNFYLLRAISDDAWYALESEL